MNDINAFTVDDARINVKQSCTPEKVQQRLEACLCAIEQASKAGKVEHFEDFVPEDEAHQTGQELARRGFHVGYRHFFHDRRDTCSMFISWRPTPPEMTWMEKLLSWWK